MNTLTYSLRIMIVLLLVGGLQAGMAGAEETKTMYAQVLEALETWPLDGGITVDFGVDETLYQETFQLTDEHWPLLREAQIPQEGLDQLAAIKNKKYASHAEFMQAVTESIGPEQAQAHERILVSSAYDGRARIAINNSFEARFRADTDCYAALIHIGIEGDIMVLLPNLKTPATQLKAGEVYSTVHDFELPLGAAGPIGEEMMLILCSTEPFDLFADTGTFDLDYAVIAPTDEPALHYLSKGLQQAVAEKSGGTAMLLEVFDPAVRGGIPKKFGQVKPMGGTGTTGKFFPPLDTP